MRKVEAIIVISSEEKEKYTTRELQIKEKDTPRPLLIVQLFLDKTSIRSRRIVRFSQHFIYPFMMKVVANFLNIPLKRDIARNNHS